MGGGGGRERPWIGNFNTFSKKKNPENFLTFATFPKTPPDFDLKLYKVIPVFKGEERDLLLADNG